MRVVRRHYLPDDVTGLELDRVAGADRERDSDTWYLRLRLRNRGYTIGRYDSRMNALLARRDVQEALQGLRPTPLEAGDAAAEPPEKQRHQTARDHYRTGIQLSGAGDPDGAQAAFERALALAEEPLLRRMIEQRLEELDWR
jgi:hypothetical protein